MFAHTSSDRTRIPHSQSAVKNASADGPSHALTTSRRLQFTLKAKDKAVLSAVFDECWPRDNQTGIPYPLKKTHRFPIAAPPYTERICYTTYNVGEGSSPEPPAKKAKQPAKPAAGGLVQGRGGAGARAGGGSRAGRRAAVAAAATREQQAGRRGGPSQNRM
eukprot:jgi/Tetstr1/445679/TSEL_003484.t1